MKKLFKSIAALMLVIIAFVTTPKAVAGPEAFGCTNSINSAVNLTSWPTNSMTTNSASNYVGQLTGGYLNVSDQSQAGFYFYCQSLTNTNTTVTFTLIRSAVQGPPGVYQDTNGNITNIDWETTATLTFSIPIVGTNPVYFITNLGESFIYPARYVGIYSITNSGNGSVLTNTSAGLIKKVIPTRWP